VYSPKLSQKNQNTPASTDSDDNEPNRLLNCVSVPPSYNNLYETIDEEQKPKAGNNFHTPSPFLVILLSIEGLGSRSTHFTSKILNGKTRGRRGDVGPLVPLSYLVCFPKSSFPLFHHAIAYKTSSYSPGVCHYDKWPNPFCNAGQISALMDLRPHRSHPIRFIDYLGCRQPN
jgi:hypothetical protein